MEKMKTFEPIPRETEKVARSVVDAAFKVHKTLGPGLLESVYEICLAHELEKRGIDVERQVPIRILYDGVHLDAGFRVDILVDQRVIVEVKAAGQMNPVFEAQLLTYLKLAGKRLGLLVNFNVPLIRNGIKRVIL